MAAILQALYLASFVSGLLAILFWFRSRRADDPATRVAHHQRFRGWLVTTMVLSGLAGACYLALVASA